MNKRYLYLGLVLVAGALIGIVVATLLPSILRPESTPPSQGTSVNVIEVGEKEEKYVKSAVKKSSSDLNVTTIEFREEKIALDAYNISIMSRLLQGAEIIEQKQTHVVLKIEDTYVLIKLEGTKLFIVEAKKAEALYDFLKRTGD